MKILVLIFFLMGCTNSSKVTVDAGISSPDNSSSFTNTKSMYFDGVDGVMNVGNLRTMFGVSAAPAISISFWFKVVGTPALYDGILGATSDPLGWSDELGCYWITSSRIYCDAPAHASGQTTTISNVNSWHHFTFRTENPGNKEFYIDGVKLSSAPAVFNNFAVPNADLEIGRIIGDGADLNSWNYKGYLDEVSIWSTALNENEVIAIYNNGSPIDLTQNSGNYVSSGSLLGYWRMGDIDQSSTNVSDQSGNNNDGILSGGTILSSDVP